MLLRTLLAVAFAVGLVGLVASDCLQPASRVAYDPYADVDWDADLALLTQFHDHAGGPNIVQTRIQAYDAAGYHVQALLHYSGCPWLAGAWGEVRDPPEAWLSASVLASLGNTEVILPSGEQVCLGEHFTTPFLTHYIEAWDPAHGSPPVKQPHQYATTQEGIDLARSLGGMVFYGHPLHSTPPDERNFDGVEVFSAHYWNAYLRGSYAADPNENMLANWDALLEEAPSILGIAVNDWLGPVA
ncbi:MAG: hypothetical protein DCC71_12835 [Proteobacteria bacterium]|nr:MAG: hypothetical protein DCC71_12835 [Pseudomonadota bacterium]